MRQDVIAIGSSAPVQGQFGAGRPQAGIGWRHVVTALLLIVVLPVFVAAGVAALAIAPVVLTVVGIHQIQQLARSQRQPAPIRERR
jgi:hypothetical protein